MIKTATIEKPVELQPTEGSVISVPLNTGKQEVRRCIKDFESFLVQHPGAEFGDEIGELKHTFVDGAYIRQITMPKGMVLTSKIHKIEHPFFVLKGVCEVLTDGKIELIKAPYWGVTKPETKRVLRIVEETVWVTVHVTDSRDLAEIEKQIILPDFENIIEHDIEKGETV